MTLAADKAHFTELFAGCLADPISLTGNFVSRMSVHGANGPPSNVRMSVKERAHKVGLFK